MQRTPPVLSAFLVALAALSSGCGDDATTEPAGPGTVVIQFNEVVSGAPLVLNTGNYTNAAGNEYTVNNLEYTVSGFAFPAAAATRADGDFTSGVVHYRTLADASTASATFADVPAGDYTAVDFVFGITGANNVDDAYPDLDLLGMAWPDMAGGVGYHYMRHEGTYTDSTMATSAYLTHLGPTMGQDYSFAVSLPHDFTVSPGETTTIGVSMDVNEWYTNPNTYDFNGHGPIMGNPAVQATLRANGASVWSVTP
jgi:MbnP